MHSNYHEEVKIKYTLKLREQLKEMPLFLGEYFRGVSDVISPRTKVGYASDLNIFFIFLLNNISTFSHKSCLKDFVITDLNIITSEHIEMFLEYITYYEKIENGEVVIYQNTSQGKSRKLSAVRAMFHYFYKKKKIQVNESSLVDFPIIAEKQITRLEVNEVAKLLDKVESGEGLTTKQLKFHNKNMKRDLAIITLLLATGMRVSECVGINITDIDFDLNAILVTRKGGNQSVLYFGDEVEKALRDYLEERVNKVAQKGHQDALFLSLQNKRLTDRSIQLLVKKYSKMVTNIKKISPHKLRSTFGSNLFQETNDIYLVAELLGHADVNTTKKHYAQMQEDRKRQAVKYIKLRED
jgi:integrase/recombinase XerC